MFTLSVGVANVAVPPVPTEITVVDRNTKDYIPFGSDNLFPQALIQLNRNSSVHRGIINNKTTYVMGDGVTTEDERVYDWLQEINGRDEGIDDVLRRVVLDWHVFGNAFVELVTDRRRSFFAIYHRDASKWRYNKDRDLLLYHPDWSKYSTNKGAAMAYPIYPEFGKVGDDGHLRSVYHFKQYEPGSEIYGIPQYIAGLNAAGIIYKTDKWNLSRLDNSFKPSGILVIDGIESEEDAQTLQQKFDEAFTGEGNTGKVMKVFKSLGGEGTQFIEMGGTYEGDWTQLHTQSEGNIITAHNWFRSLAGIADNTGFDTKRILQEYEVAKNTVIRDTQNYFLRRIEKLLYKHAGIDAELQITNRPPATIAGLLDANKVTRIWEARELLGLEYDSEDPEQMKFIDNKTTNGGNTTDNGG